jgi:hypothetical protein
MFNNPEDLGSSNLLAFDRKKPPVENLVVYQTGENLSEPRTIQKQFHLVNRKIAILRSFQRYPRIRGATVLTFIRIKPYVVKDILKNR